MTDACKEKIGETSIDDLDLLSSKGNTKEKIIKEGKKNNEKIVEIFSQDSHDMDII